MQNTFQPMKQHEVDAIYRKITLRIIPFLILGYIAAYLDRSNIGFARVQMMGDLGFTELVYGLGAGLFYLGYSLFEVPSNLLLKKIGARLTFARIMIAWGIISGVFAFVSSATEFAILRFLLGCAEAGFFPGVLLYITFWVPQSRRARFTAMFMSALVLSGLIGGPISGGIMHSMEGVLDMRGWQWLFIIESIPAILLGILALVWLTDKPSDAKWLSDREKAQVKFDLENEEKKKDKAPSKLLDAIKEPKLYILCVMAVALVSGIGGLSFWLPTMLHEAGFENFMTLGLVAAIPYAVSLVVQQWVAYNSDRTNDRRWHVVVCAAVCCASWFLLPSFSSSPIISVLLLSLTCAGAFGATGPFWSMPSGFLSGAAAAGGIAVVTSVGSMSAFLSPIFVGWITDKTGSLAAGQYYYGVLFLLASLALASPKLKSSDIKPAVGISN